MKTRKILVAVTGLATAGALVGLGVGASFTDSGSATQRAKVGTFSIMVTSSNGVVSGNSVTQTLNLVSSAASTGSGLNFTVKSIGSIPARVTVTPVLTGVVAPFSDSLVNPGAVTLNQGESQVYNGGQKWLELVNGDLGKTSTITYNISAGEVPAVVGLPDGTVQITSAGVVDVVNVSTWKTGASTSFPVANGDTLYMIGSSGAGFGLVATAANGKISYHGTVSMAGQHYLSLHQLVAGAPGSENYWFPLT